MMTNITIFSHSSCHGTETMISIIDCFDCMILQTKFDQQLNSNNNVHDSTRSLREEECQLRLLLHRTWFEKSLEELLDVHGVHRLECKTTGIFPEEFLGIEIFLRWFTARTWINLLKSIEIIACWSLSELYNKNRWLVSTAYCFFHAFFLTFSLGICTQFRRISVKKILSKSFDVMRLYLCFHHRLSRWLSKGYPSIVRDPISFV